MTLSEQRLFCWRVAHAIVQMDLRLSVHDVGDDLFRWCQGEDDPKLAFKCLEYAYELRGGALTTSRLLTKAKDAYTFSRITESRVASKTPSSSGSQLTKGPNKKKAGGPRVQKGSKSLGSPPL